MEKAAPVEGAVPAEVSVVIDVPAEAPVAVSVPVEVSVVIDVPAEAPVAVVVQVEEEVKLQEEVGTNGEAPLVIDETVVVQGIYQYILYV
jgi:hypothetical protein